MKITYWSDYACPYCYIGETKLKKAIAQIPGLEHVEFEMKAFQLDPTAGLHAEGDTQTRFAQKYGISFEEAGRRVEGISAMGCEEGLDFKYATTLFTNTMDAHRLTKLAQSKEDKTIAERLRHSLYHAYFTENKELADKKLLHELGLEAGLEEAEVEGLLATHDFEEAVLEDQQEAYRSGIHSVPFFVIGKYGVSGAQPTDVFKEVLEKVLAEVEEA